MDKNELEACAYRDYCVWLYELPLVMSVDDGLILNDVIAQAQLERIFKEKEEKSLIKKLLIKLGLRDFEHEDGYKYCDLVLTLMKYMNKAVLTTEDIDFAETKDFYEQYFKESFLEYQQFKIKYNFDSLSEKDQIKFKKREKELFEKVIPPYGGFDINKNLYEL